MGLKDKQHIIVKTQRAVNKVACCCVINYGDDGVMVVVI